MSTRDINTLLDDLGTDADLQRRWELDPTAVLAEYALTETQAGALLDGNVDALISEGLAERHVQQMRVSW